MSLSEKIYQLLRNKGYTTSDQSYELSQLIAKMVEEDTNGR